MAASSRTQLTVEILTDATKAAQGLNQAAQGFESFAGKAKGALVGAFAGFAVADVIKQAVSAASDLQQAMGGVDAVFKQNASQIHSWASDTSDSIRLPQAEFEQLATVIGAQLKNAGVSMDQLAPKTHDLIQLGADLGARFGTSTSQAVEALSSALKGEMDPIERFGITLNANAIKAEEMALGLDTSTAAAEQSAKAQATLSLIMKQSADAQGAASSESDTYAAAQEHLNEVWTNMLAAVGGPLLSTLASLMDALSGLLPIIEPLFVGVSKLVVGLTELPGPALATIAAFSGWMALQSFTGAAALIPTIMLNARVALMLAATAVRGFLASIGPVGWAILAIGGIATAISVFSHSAEDDLKAVEDSYTSMTDAFKQGGIEKLKEALFDTSAAGGFDKALTNAGVSMKTYIDASTGAAGASEQLAAEAKAASASIFDQGKAFASIGDDARAAGISTDQFLSAVASGDLTQLTAQMQDYANTQADATGNTQTGIDIMNRWSDATNNGQATAAALVNVTDLAAQNQEKLSASLGDAADKARALGTSEGDLAANTLDAASAQAKLKEDTEAAKKATESTGATTFLTAMKNETDNANRALEIFLATIQAYTTRNEAAEAGTVGWVRGLQDASSALSKMTQEGTVSADSLANWDVRALQATDSSRAAYDALTNQASGYAAVVTEAYNAAGGVQAGAAATNAAAEAATAARTEFVNMAMAAGLTETQANQLANQLGILNAQQIDPKVFELIAQDEGARLKLQQLQAQGIDPKTVTVSAVTDPATGAVNQMLSYIDASGATVTVDAAVDPAQGDISKVEGGNYQATVDTDANTNEATRTINQTASNDYRGTIKVSADTSQANRFVTDTMSYINRLQASITVQANDQATSRIYSITAGYYQATVHVVADTSAFYATYNSLPTSKTITQQVVTVPAPGPPALMAGVSTLATPMSTPRGSTSTASTGSINITINGAVDADSTARQIQTLLRTRVRRNQGIEIGTGALVI